MRAQLPYYCEDRVSLVRRCRKPVGLAVARKGDRSFDYRECLTHEVLRESRRGRHYRYRRALEKSSIYVVLVERVRRAVEESREFPALDRVVAYHDPVGELTTVQLKSQSYALVDE